MSFTNSSIFNQGDVSSRAVQGQSATAFATALAIGIAASAGQLLGFVLLKDKLPQIYQPKSFLVPARQRTKPLPPGAWQWFKPVFRRSDDDFLRRCGLDAYFLARYLYVLLKILFPISIPVLPILLSINGAGGNNKAANVAGTGRNVTQGLDILTMSNVQPQYYDRFWAHCLLAILVVIWTCYIIVGELRHFIRVRQTYLTSPQHRLRASASTVLIQGMPRKYADPDKVANLFDVYPGGIRNVWVNHNYHKLDKLIKERDKMCKKLEKAEGKLIKQCWVAYEKRIKEDKTGSVTSLPQQDGAVDDHLDPSAQVGDGISANNPGQVHHNVSAAVEDINRLDAEDEARMAMKAAIFDKGLGAAGRGIRGIGRGVGGGISNIGRGLQRVTSRRGRTGSPEGEVAAVDQVASDSTTSREIVVPKSATQPGEADSSLSRTLSVVDRKPAPPLAEDAEKLSAERTSNSTNADNLTFNLYYDNEAHLEPRWRKFIEQKDRPTITIKQKYKWIPAFMNTKVTKLDEIWYRRRELARLNRLIEGLQEPEAERLYPPMRSAFIQFNNQAAAHMAAQSLAHHTPTFMTPRMIEMAPNDVIWKNMSIPGWAQYVRKGLVFLGSIGLLIVFTPLVAASSAISQLDVLKKTPGFSWLKSVPGWGIAIIQGIVPIILVNLLILAIGALLRLLIRQQGAVTRMRVELSVQNYFFIFSFIQYFIIVTVASAVPLVYITIKTTVEQGNVSIFLIPQLLAQNIPQASNYFLANILVQSLSQSAGGLLQPITLIAFAWKRTFNKTARSKYKTRTSLQKMQWGTTYPLYTTLACVALIYSIISPLILPLSMIGFAIWWICTRYQMLYIFNYKTDTGGLLYPTAIKQLFTGLIVLELYLFGFFIVISTASDANDTVSRGTVLPMAIIIVILLIGTIIFYYILCRTFNPLLEYLPITLEDDAVERDEKFAELLQQRHDANDEAKLLQHAAEGGPEDHDDDETDRPGTGRDSERPSPSKSPSNDDPEAPPEMIEPNKPSGASPPAHTGPHVRGAWHGIKKRSTAFARSSKRHKGEAEAETDSTKALQQQTIDETPEKETESDGKQPQEKGGRIRNVADNAVNNAVNWAHKPLEAEIAILNPGQAAAEAQTKRLQEEAERLYGGIPDDLESLTVEQRDTLLSRAFKHKALRAKRPCVWLPRDKLGVSDDEIRNTALLTKYIWISNEKQYIDDKDRFDYTGPPPDFDEVDLIQL